MRSSKIKSPSHYDKVCDIAVEAIVQLYTNKNEFYKSNLLSYIYDGTLNILGTLSSNNHYTDVEILNFIKTHIDIDIDINLNFIKLELIENLINTNSDTFLGYCCNENPEGIPFEQLEALTLSKYLYDNFKIPFELEITINGKEINVIIETNYLNKNEISDKVEYYITKSENYLRNSVFTTDFNKKTIYSSSNNFISNFYGPRSPYGNTNFIGLDIYNNYRYSHLISREISKKYLNENKLNYCLVELTYHSNKELPIQIGIKGNDSGIHLENGTFFIYSNDYNMYSIIKNNVIKNINSNKTSLIDIAKWGII
jgi:S-adenosylmethionine synthetase